jgi:probable F420-dependent oxidoreductase
MKFVCPLPNLSRVKAVAQPWEASVKGVEIGAIAKRAEALGYDMLRMPEHLVVPREHIELSGPHYVHSAAAQGYLLGATERIRVMSAVTILPLQHPIAIGKALASVDWLSGGRLNAAFGVGWLKGEFDALGVPFEKRGRMMDEYLAALIELWTRDWPSFEGEFVAFKDVAFEPKPVQTPHIPIWLGGDADTALKRAARFASGWIPFLTSPDDFAARLDFIKSQPTYTGGDFEVAYTLSSALIGEGHVSRNPVKNPSPFSAPEMIDTFGWLRDCGVTIASFAIPPTEDCTGYLDYIQWFAETVKPEFD